MTPTKNQFLAALRQIEALTASPAILSGALRLLRDPAADIESITALVSRDASLVAGVIRCANSAYYGGTPSGSLGEAVNKIGLRETIRILNMAVAQIVSGRDLACYGIPGSDYWAESLFNGLFMQALAGATDRTDADEAYTAGLLRFIGRLAINQAVENLHCGVFWDGNESLTQWEIGAIGLSQAEAGAILLASWHFPESIVQAVGVQDHPATAEPRNWLADALHFCSTVLPQGIGTPFLPSVGPTWSPTASVDDFMGRSRLGPADVDTLLAATSRTFDAIRATLAP